MADYFHVSLFAHVVDVIRFELISLTPVIGESVDCWSDSAGQTVQHFLVDQRRTVKRVIGHLGVPFLARISYLFSFTTPCDVLISVEQHQDNLT